MSTHVGLSFPAVEAGRLLLFRGRYSCWVNYGKIFIIYIGKFNSSNITNLFAREPQRAWAAADIRVSLVLLL